MCIFVKSGLTSELQSIRTIHHFQFLFTDIINSYFEFKTKNSDGFLSDEKFNHGKRFVNGFGNVKDRSFENGVKIP
jgi:hypothetical protein